MSQQWKIRSATGDDLSFIYATWLKSYRVDSSIGATCKTSIFFEEYNRILDAILGAPDTTVSVAASSDDPNVIYGYAVTQPGVLHYVFVKEAFRKLGIARSLVAPEIGTLRFYTHRTFSAAPILGQLARYDYNPFLLFKQIQGEQTYVPSIQTTH